MAESPMPANPMRCCGICGEAIEHPDEVVITASSALHVACVEQSAAAA